jgi:cytochrome c oxidase subunit II
VLRRFRNQIAFIVITAIVTLVTCTFYLLVVSDPAQRNAAERTAPAVIGMPVNFQLSLHLPFSPFHHEARALNHYLLALNLFVCGVVGILALYVVWRYRRSRNQVPSATTHNTALEAAWTIAPAVILVFICVPSFRLLHDHNIVSAPAELTLKVIGHQWYWEYQYPDYGGLSVQSVIVPDNQLTLQEKGKRLLVPDQYAVLPVNATIRIQITGADVIHSFFVPSLGLQRYAVPGRLNETWTRIEHEGVYYGQCNQICGMNHAFMPIAIRVVSRQEFEAWVSGQRVAAAPEGEKAKAGEKAPPASKTPPAAPSERTLSGSDALALAALVGQYSPLIPKTAKRALSNLVDGRLNFRFPAKKKIPIEADSINCRAGAAGLASYACDLKFANKSVVIHGRKAHELVATLIEAGTASHQEEGTLHHALNHLSCEITPSEIQHKVGGGSECRFELASH